MLPNSFLIIGDNIRYDTMNLFSKEVGLQFKILQIMYIVYRQALDFSDLFSCSFC